MIFVDDMTGTVTDDSEIGACEKLYHGALDLTMRLQDIDLELEVDKATLTSNSEITLARARALFGALGGARCVTTRRLGIDYGCDHPRARGRTPVARLRVRKHLRGLRGYDV